MTAELVETFEREAQQLVLTPSNRVAYNAAKHALLSALASPAAISGDGSEPVAHIVERLNGTKRSVMLVEKYDPRRPEFWASENARAEYRVTPLFTRPSEADAVPEGMVLVPQEPTEEMVDAFAEAAAEAREAAREENRRLNRPNPNALAGKEKGDG